MINWLAQNWLELFGTISALVYLYFSIKQNVWLWPLGILASAVYAVVYLQTRFYADMALQLYYLLISFYGWYFWVFGKSQSKEVLNVSSITRKMSIYILLISLVLFVLIAFVLNYFTDSDVPIGDALTTAFSITATYLLAKKIMEHWLIWIVVDALSLGLYLYKGLYITSVLFFIYTVMAVVGYIQWRKQWVKANEQNILITD